MRFDLPFPPSCNRYWRVCRGRVFVSAEAKAYKATVAQILAGMEPMVGELVLTVDFYRPAKRGDLDNRLKVLGDALNGLAWADDKQVGEIHARQFDDKKDPRCEVTVTERGK